jgi:hypothetical protein
MRLVCSRRAILCFIGDKGLFLNLSTFLWTTGPCITSLISIYKAICSEF